MSIKIWQLKSVAGQLSDRLKTLTGQNKNLPFLSDSPADFAKTAILLADCPLPGFKCKSGNPLLEGYQVRSLVHSGWQRIPQWCNSQKESVFECISFS